MGGRVPVALHLRSSTPLMGSSAPLYEATVRKQLSLKKKKKKLQFLFYLFVLLIFFLKKKKKNWFIFLVGYLHAIGCE
jgi:hypothetical protein